MSHPTQVHNIATFTGETGPLLTKCQRVRLVVDLSLEDVQRLAAHYVERTAAGQSILAAEAKELAVPLLAALVAAGFPQE
jgi:hypothetical protein